MKQEWKPEELRATSEEIRGAVMPKSITPEVVGGTLSGLTDALAEVIEVLGEIPKEHVAVKVRGYDGKGVVSGAGATVWLDIFHTKGYPVVSVPRQELTCDEEGVVEFDVPHGYRYAIFSQIAGLGASFQLVETAAAKTRELKLWNMPIGVNHLYLVIISVPGSTYRSVPFITYSYSDDSGILEKEGLEWGVDLHNGEKVRDWHYFGILVSTAETAFVIAPNSKSDEIMGWSGNRDCGALIPGMPYINNDSTDGEWQDCQNRARADYDGNMNTAKILDYCHNPKAADFCANSITYSLGEQWWLPSAGQAYLMSLNNGAINSLMAQVNTANGNTDFVLLPSLNPGSTSQWTHYENWWTSTLYNNYFPWVVDYNGNINYCEIFVPLDVRAVVAFNFER